MGKCVQGLCAGLICLATSVLFAGAVQSQQPPYPGVGEWARLALQPMADAPPTVMWGPHDVPDLRGYNYGFYGMTYHGWNDRLNAIYFWHKNIKRYRSLDATLPARPETIPEAALPISVPANDSFQDIAYCRYDNSLLLHSSKLKTVYKIDAATGEMKWEFASPATQYPTGIAWDERGKRIYLADRMINELYSDPCTLYVCDTLGNVEFKRALTHLSALGRWGARCLDMDYSNTNPNWPSLLLNYTYFDNSGTFLDSVVLFELDRTTLNVINRAKLPSFTGSVENVRGVAWDPRNGDYWIGIMQRALGYEDNAVYKMDGWHQPVSPDVGIVSLIQPRGACSVGVNVNPQAIVRNFGVAPATFPVRMFIPGTGYDETRTKTIVAGREDTVNFPVWVPSAAGSFTARCTTGLVGDVFAANDTWSEPVVVYSRPDVGCTRILVPVSTLDSGVVFTPACSVYNYGGQTVSYSAMMRIGGFYEKTANVIAHGSGLRYVEFPLCTLNALGSVAVACSTRLSGDGQPGNDKAEVTIFSRLLDAELVSILAPVGTLDSGTSVVPRATVRNRGNTTVTLDAKFDIADGAGFSTTKGVADLAPSEEREVVFDDAWTVPGRASYATKCSTRLGEDRRNDNDFKTGSVSGKVSDVEVLAITAPLAALDSGPPLEPSATVRNNGSAAATFDVRFVIDDGTDYTSVRTVSGLAPGETEEVTFEFWTPQRGTFAMRCTTLLDYDIVEENNLKDGTVTVRVLDAEAISILAPVGQVPPGIPLLPRATVRNRSSVAQSFDVEFSIADGSDDYASVQATPSLAPGASWELEFDEWTPGNYGTFDTKCTTRLASDMVSDNDLVTGTVQVLGTDVAARQIVVPRGAYPVGEVVAPVAVWRNNGAQPAAFEAWMILESPGATRHAQKVDVVGLAPGEDTTVTDFAGAALDEPGTWSVRCSTYLAGDENPDNDTLDDEFEVRSGGNLDVAVDAIVEPAGEVARGEDVTPRATVENKGDFTTGFAAWFVLKNPAGDEKYREEMDVAWLIPGAETTLVFPDHTIGSELGTWAAKCSVFVADDADPDNDWREEGFVVRKAAPNWSFGWAEMRTMPILPSNRMVKDGGWIVADPVGEKVLAAKGNKTGDFYRYDPFDNSWTPLETIPSLEDSKRKPVSKGSAAAFDGEGRYAYATKGNNTLGFWRYDVEQDTWERLNPVLPGPQKRKVKGGTDLVRAPGAGAECIYLLKGIGTEFYRYNPGTGEWQALGDVPFGGGRARYGKGSFLVYDGEEFVYAHQASRHDGQNHYMFRFNVLADSWEKTARKGMPVFGTEGGRWKKKKSKDGAAGGWYDGSIYALKGGNTQGFFRYYPDEDSWTETWRPGLGPDTVPMFGQTNKKKRVKNGGDISYFDYGAFFALKGNKTLEVWRYRLPPDGAQAQARTQARDGVQAGVTGNGEWRMGIGPNPLSSGFATLRFSLPKSGPATVTIFDVAGRSVFSTRSPGHLIAGSLSLDLRRLSSGVYLVRLEADGVRATQKVVISGN